MAQRHTFALAGGLASVVAPLLLVVAMVALTVHQRDYLSDVGWSPVGRTPTQWPSLLALGPSGWVLVLTFAINAVSGALLAAGLWTQASSLRSRVRAAGVTLAVLGLVGVTFPADPPSAAFASWHASIHNGLYPFIPLGIMVAAIASAWPTSLPDHLGERLATGSRLLVPLMFVSFAATNVDAVAQLARYFAFATLLAWVALAGHSLLRQRTALQSS